MCRSKNRLQLPQVVVGYREATHSLVGLARPHYEAVFRLMPEGRYIAQN